VFRFTNFGFTGSRLFLCDLPTAHEPALAPERELSQLAALRQATPLGRFSARANMRAAVWDKPRSSLRRREERWFMGSSLFLFDLLTGHEPALAPERELSQLAALRQATRLSRFSARANMRAAVWDKPRSDCTVGVSRFMESAGERCSFAQRRSTL
jgi:hypothetical protein